MKAAAVFSGSVSFVHHAKQYITITYEVNAKEKSINGIVHENEQALQLKAGKITSIHHFRMGDQVTFETKQVNGKMVATNIRFLYNNALNSLIDKAAIDNRFTGYLKNTDAGYFIKDAGSYILFPLELSPWELEPDATLADEPIVYRINNSNNLEKVTASLAINRFMPEYQKAMKWYKEKAVIEAPIFKTSPYAIYVKISGEKVEAKITLNKTAADIEKLRAYKVGDTIKIRISFLGPQKIVVEPLLD
jgi:hypothetical protein